MANNNKVTTNETEIKEQEVCSTPTMEELRKDSKDGVISFGEVFRKSATEDQSDDKTTEGLQPISQEDMDTYTPDPEQSALEQFGDGVLKDKLTIKPVPLKNQDLYKEEDLMQLSMGRPGYLKLLAKKYKDKPSRLSTGIPDLDEITGGGWVTNGMSVVAAAPNVGKTTILMQSACAMAQQGTAVVFITNDMRKVDLEAKVISQISYSLIGKNCLTISDITNHNALLVDDIHTREIARRLEKTMKYLHIRDLISDEEFDKECDNDLLLADKDKLTRIFLKYTTVYEKVIFIVDSLQQVASYISYGKEGVDNILRTFKEMSAVAPVVMVSTLNRTGYSKQGEINFADLKESGAVEYNADLIVTMIPKFAIEPDTDMDLKTFKTQAEREIVISCKKSRDSGEKSVAMTLYAPGCTFVKYNDDGIDHPSSAPVVKKKTGKKTVSPFMPTMNISGWNVANE